MLAGARRAGWLSALLASGLLVLGGCAGGTSAPLGTGPSSVVEQGDGPPSNTRGSELPVLVEVESKAAENYTRVRLEFEPGTEKPEVELTEYGRSAIPVPGSAEPVDLRGEQALKAVVSPAQVDKVNVAAVRRSDPAVAEVVVLGGSENRVSIGIGVKGAGELRPKTEEFAYREESERPIIVISLRNPAYQE